MTVGSHFFIVAPVIFPLICCIPILVDGDLPRNYDVIPIVVVPLSLHLTVSPKVPSEEFGYSLIL